MNEQTEEEKDMHNLKHMVNATWRDKRKHGNRNYFAAGRGEQEESMQRLLLKGLVVAGIKTEHLNYYHATKLGCEYAGLHKAAINRALASDS